MHTLRLSGFLFFLFISQYSAAQSWSTVASGMGNDIHGFTIFDNELVVGGSFNGTPGNHIVSWDGVAWSAFGSGTGKVVRAVVEWNGNLVACGDFWNVGQPCTDCNGIAMWNGTAWVNLGTGFDNDVLALTVWNGNLIAAGDFTSCNGDTSINRVAMWNGTTWSGFNTGFNNDTRALTVYNGELIAGGDFSNASGNGAADRIARWDVGDGEWKKLVTGGLDSTVRTLRVIGTDLYVGGHFLEVDGNTNCAGIARYDGTNWFALGNGVNSYVRAIAEYGGEVYIGGDFTMAGAVSANRIARWNGTTWQPLTTGVTAYIRALEEFQGSLYVGGSFHEAGGLVADYIAKWTMPIPFTSVVSSVTNVNCAGQCTGSATVTPTGGTGPYTYQWSASAGSQTTATATSLCAGTHSVVITDNVGAVSNQTITITAGTSATANSTVTSSFNGYSISCNGGTNGVAVATGTGQAPLTYQWSASAGNQTTATATGLSAGTHTVTVTDNNGCTATSTVTLTAPSALSSTATKTNITCFGLSNGTAAVAATGGVTNYSYQWSTSAGSQTTASVSGLAAGTHSVTVTDQNGCTSTSSVIITQPTQLVLNIASGNVSCNGGSNGFANGSLSGGTAGYTYLWSSPSSTNPNLTNLSPGTYSLTGTDANGCTTTQSVTITQPSAITITQTNNVNSSCSSNTGSATVIATGGTGTFSYSWNTSPVQTGATANNLAAGNYIVTAQDANACIQTFSVTIQNAGAPTLTVSTNDVNCNSGNDGSATAGATGGTGPYSYSWNTTPVQTGTTANNLAAGNYSVTVSDNNGCVSMQTFTITQPSSLTVSTTSAGVSCNGGNDATASAAATGGTSPYIYSWTTTPVQFSSNAINLSAGNYSVTITDDNGCITTQNVTITEPAPISVSANSTDASCNGGNDATATATATGGAGTFTYSWNSTPVQSSSTATNLAAGVYVVTVTDINICSTTQTVTVNQPAAIMITYSATNATCNGINDGTATAFATGGTGSHTYSWNTTPVQNTQTATNLAPGNYLVTATDANGCASTQTVTVGSSAIMQITLTGTGTLCNGGNDGFASATATGGSGSFSYSWNTIPAQTTSTATGLPAGTWCVTATDGNGCMIDDCVTITEPAPLAGTFSSNPSATSCTGELSITMTNGTAPYSYLWDLSAGNQTTQTATGLCAGNYCVEVTDANGCLYTGCSDVLLVDGVGENSAIEIQIFPNPASGNYFFISIPSAEKISSVMIYDLNGKEIPFSNTMQNELMKIEVEKSHSGLFFVVIQFHDGSSISEKILLNP
jgi:hypothetical protein